MIISTFVVSLNTMKTQIKCVIYLALLYSSLAETLAVNIQMNKNKQKKVLQRQWVMK